MMSTTDIWFAGFLTHLGYKMTKFEKLGRSKVKCFYELSDTQWEKAKLDFHNSELSKFKGYIEQIKDLGY